MKLKSMRLENYRCFKEANIDFDDPDINRDVTETLNQTNQTNSSDQSDQSDRFIRPI